MIYFRYHGWLLVYLKNKCFPSIKYSNIQGKCYPFRMVLVFKTLNITERPIYASNPYDDLNGVFIGII